MADVKVRKTYSSRKDDSIDWTRCETKLEAADFSYENNRLLDEKGKDLSSKEEIAQVKIGNRIFSLEFRQHYDDDAGGDPQYNIRILDSKGQQIPYKNYYYTGERTSAVSRDVIDAYNRALTDGVLSNKENNQMKKIGSTLEKALMDDKLDASEAANIQALARQVAPGAKRTAYCK
jgi:hypothetical protein